MLFNILVLAQPCDIKCNAGETCTAFTCTKRACPPENRDCNRCSYRCVAQSVSQCSVCKLIVQKVVIKKNSGANVDQLNYYISTVCQSESFFNRVHCKIVVAQYKQEIVKQVMAGTVDVCPSLQICNGKIPPPSVTPVPR